ncbi:uncharacterized protein BJX67DRAFT_385181 [Aspergillus lucknowensis]|uniref:Uncharacterized protein n=1 Tax=Aspergillus lucknowensis TaxID=176173 RepID=A0ABR4LHM6_9EURO
MADQSYKRRGPVHLRGDPRSITRATMKIRIGRQTMTQAAMFSLGFRRAIDFMKAHTDPKAKQSVIVWHVRKDPAGTGWEKRVIFEDDGSNISTASAAVLVPIEPVEGGAKEAWLYVTGFASESMVAVKVKL